MQSILKLLERVYYFFPPFLNASVYFVNMVHLDPSQSHIRDSGATSGQCLPLSDKVDQQTFHGFGLEGMLNLRGRDVSTNGLL